MMACSLLPLPLRPSPPPNSYHFFSHQHHLIASCFSRSRPYYHYSQSQQQGRRLLLNNNKSNGLLFFVPSIHPSLTHYPLKPYPAPAPALDSDAPRPTHQTSDKLKKSNSFEQWDWLTAKFAGASNLPFLLLQLPQIILNARNLMAGNKSALLAVPWLGMFTGLLGNLSLLSYFAKKRETEVVVVQTLGVVSIYVVIAQLAMAEAMPLPHFVITSFVVASGLILNFLYYFELLNLGIWRFWEDFITIAGLSALPQVMWSTFVPYIQNSILPGVMAFIIAVVAVIMFTHSKTVEETVESTIVVTKSRLDRIRSTSSAHFNQAIDYIQDVKTDYSAYEDMVFGKIKEGILVAASHPLVKSYDNQLFH
ncbi:unnamed protein product [Ilex paraguariensis]|uniref:Uncharacterized protein n=1 Tax=Ilex paraguariensis TaxID=185542 RepID=A0ABC8T9B9_9AQUA